MTLEEILQEACKGTKKLLRHMKKQSNVKPPLSRPRLSSEEKRKREEERKLKAKIVQDNLDKMAL
jgi:hypothetical protein